MSNPYIEYYKTQAGTGLTGFQGVRYQRGHGFFGRLLSKAVYPLLRFLGKKAVGVGADLANDIIVEKKNWKDAAKERFDEVAQDVVKAGVKKAKNFAQKGSGQKRRIKIKTKRQRKTKKAMKKPIKRKQTRKKNPSKIKNTIF